MASAAPRRRTPLLLAALLGVGLLIAGVVWLAGGFGGGAAPVVLNPPVEGDDPGADDADPRGEVEVGGVRRPASDVRRPERVGEDEIRPGWMPEFGRQKPIPADTNSNTRSVYEAATTGEHPERLSTLIPANAFDEQTYKANPQPYLDVIEPGRVWQSLQPGPDVPRLTGLSAPRTTIAQGETTGLRVKALPGAPVTFTSFDLGAFQNRLTSVTVAADADGIAVGRFTGTSGTLFDVHILASSPMTSGQLAFTVTVDPPRASGLNGAAVRDGAAAGDAAGDGT